MSEITVIPESVPTRAGRLMKYLLQALILLPVVAGFYAYQFWMAPPVAAPLPETQAAATVISQKSLEERFGISIKLIGVTAAGGMVDFRYKILDKEKAAFLFGPDNDTVKLIADDNGTTLGMPAGHGMNHHGGLKNGVVNFHFFANTDGAVKAGRPVTVVIGSLRLEPITAQ